MLEVALKVFINIAFSYKILYFSVDVAALIKDIG